jgi:hypothetical protein
VFKQINGNNTQQTLRQFRSQHNEKRTSIYARTTLLTTHCLLHTRCESTTTSECEHAIPADARETPILVNLTNQKLQLCATEGKSDMNLLFTVRSENRRRVSLE